MENNLNIVKQMGEGIVKDKDFEKILKPDILIHYVTTLKCQIMVPQK
jgi:hypothetical protein